MIDKIIAFIQADQALQELLAYLVTMGLITAMFPVAIKIIDRKN